MHAVTNKRAKKTGAYYSNSPAYRTRLSFYKIPPNEEIVMDEFDTFALDRLKGNV